MLKCDEKTAGNKIAEHFNIDAPRSRQNNGGTFNGEEWAKGLDPNHDALGPLGIAPETCSAFGAGYNATRPSLKGTLCIAVRDLSGKPVCFIGVHPETLDVHFPEGAEVPSFLNSDRISVGVLHVVSDPLDVLRHLEAGIPELANTIAVLAPITPELLEQLATMARDRGATTLEFH